MDIKAYLERITYTGTLTRSAEALRGLQKAHLIAVPFENFSIHRNEPIILNDEALFDKIVKRRRGGFCYELNGLFAALLRGLDFDVTMLSARVAMEEGGYSPEFAHMTLLVKLDDPWLVDVGFGDSFREPLQLENEKVQSHDSRDYQVIREAETLTLMERKDGASWSAQYCFTLTPYQYADYVECCHFHQTSDASPFRKRQVCSRATTEGRLTLADRRLITTTVTGARQEMELKGDEEYERVLRQYFGIVL